MSLRPRLAIALLLGSLGLGALGLGCTSPTLPLPPPNVSALEYRNEQVTIEGTAIAGSLVFAYNQGSGSGGIYRAEDDGHYFMVIEGEPGDIVAIWQQDGDEISPTIERLVPSPSP